MESKLTAQFSIIFFIVLTIVAILLRYVLNIDFSLKVYFQYLLLFTFATILVGRPIVKLALNLIRTPYRQNEEHFPIPGSKIEPEQTPKKS